MDLLGSICVHLLSELQTCKGPFGSNCTLLSLHTCKGPFGSEFQACTVPFGSICTLSVTVRPQRPLGDPDPTLRASGIILHCVIYFKTNV